MTDSHDLLWQAKLAAWIHDPAEKALVLLRDRSGHEGGTVRALRAALFPHGVPDGLAAHLKRADHWASAADRPQFPKGERDGRYPAWTQVDFAARPVLIHPLSGEAFDLHKLDVAPAQLKAVSTDHFEGLIHRDAAGAVDARRTALAFWRFGPETPAAGLGALWGLLPADTRVPDHTIWAHLDLTAAFAGAFVADADANPALLAMSFGPVQDFIAAARTTSDLWAGSHLLSRLAWEGLKVVAARLGPDAVLFPQLRDVPLVDLWLREEMNLARDRFERCEWTQGDTDSNPLFAAALPNRFVAVVPAGAAREIAESVTEAVRAWVRNEAEEGFADLLQKAGGYDLEADYPAYAQIREQLAGFPDVHWAAVPFAPLVTSDAAGKVADTAELRAALEPFHPQGSAGFLDSDAWQLLSRELAVDGAKFFTPNPGTLYPALYDLLDRVQAAAKSVRPFGALAQQGYRCSLSGETEWLTTDRAQLDLPPGSRSDTLWTRVAAAQPAWARKGEHLGALATLKRLWPSRFARQMREQAGVGAERYVVSTHTLALATTLDGWLADARPTDPDTLALAAQCAQAGRAVLPKRLADALRRERIDPDDPRRVIAERLPGRLDELRDAADDAALARVQVLAERALGARPETYYGLILFDGDRMGAWLSGAGEEGRDFCLPYRESWHPQIREALATRTASGRMGGDLDRYLDSRRAVSPARHMAVSGALNAFALTLARPVVEDLCKGKLLYAGGDDVLALVSVDDLLPAAALLRLAYSAPFADAGEFDGVLQTLGVERDGKGLQLARGHALYRDRLLRVMGARATASCGLAIAHHQAPLGAVLRELRAAEKDAKNAGRDAFAVRLLKRSGGDVRVALPWLVNGWRDLTAERFRHGPFGLLERLRQMFARRGEVSRRAAYHAQAWLPDLPPRAAFADADAYAELLATTLAYQLARQGGDAVGRELGRELGTLAVALTGGRAPQDGVDPAVALIRDALGVAEFLAREGRSNPAQETGR